MRWLCIVPALCLVTAGCAGKLVPLAPSARLAVVPNDTVLPSPERGDLIAADRPSLIGPLDVVLVDVFNVPELSREIQVDASGRIAMPLAGTLDASGRTAEELANAIRMALRQSYIRDPQVTVNLKSSVSQVVTIDGQVTEPGLYPVTNGRSKNC